MCLVLDDCRTVTGQTHYFKRRKAKNQVLLIKIGFIQLIAPSKSYFHSQLDVFHVESLYVCVLDGLTLSTYTQSYHSRTDQISVELSSSQTDIIVSLVSKYLLEH